MRMDLRTTTSSRASSLPKLLAYGVDITSKKECPRTSIVAGLAQGTQPVIRGREIADRPFTWKVVNGKLPAGLRMAKFFGVESTEITGTPTKTETNTFTAQVTDGARNTAQQAFRITINPPLPLVITSGNCCPTGTVGTAYHTNFFASGGVQPYTWSIPSGQIPPGLTLASRPPAGLSGTPTTAGTFTFTVAVTDHAGTQTTEPGTITVS